MIIICCVVIYIYIIILKLCMFVCTLYINNLIQDILPNCTILRSNQQMLGMIIVAYCSTN
jgi:hypothetical protein